MIDPMKLRDDFLIFGAPQLTEDDAQAVMATLRSGWIGTGPRVAQFERDFAAYKGVPEDRVAAVNSCTAALHLSLLAAGLEPGDEVITTPMTFCATANSILHAGLVPVIADVDPDSFNISPAAVERAITPRTKALLPVHFAGRPCDMDALMGLATRHGLKVIEDCAHAIESRYRGRSTGTFGDFGCFSFYVTKNVVTGEGGMVVSRDVEAAGRLKMLALHGMSKHAWRRFGDSGFKHYQVLESGYKYNMMDMQAALGIGQLARVEANWLRRQAVWDRYQSAFARLPLGLPAAPEPDTRHAFHLYTILVDEAVTGVARDEFLDRMTARKVGVGVHYLSLPEHPFYQRALGWRPEEYPVAARIGRQTVSLPISARLTDADVDYVIEAVEDCLARPR